MHEPQRSGSRIHSWPQSTPSRARGFVLALVLLLFGSRFAQGQTLTIRLAGDEWFLDSLTKAQVIPDFEKQTGMHVEVLHKSDRTILSDLDRGINRFLSRRSVPARPQLHAAGTAVSRLAAGTQFVWEPYLWISLHRTDDFPGLSQRSSGRSRVPAQLQVPPDKSERLQASLPVRFRSRSA